MYEIQRESREIDIQWDILLKNKHNSILNWIESNWIPSVLIIILTLDNRFGYSKWIIKIYLDFLIIN